MSIPYPNEYPRSWPSVNSPCRTQRQPPRRTRSDRWLFNEACDSPVEAKADIDFVCADLSRYVRANRLRLLGELVDERDDLTWRRHLLGRRPGCEIAGPRGLGIKAAETLLDGQ